MSSNCDQMCRSSLGSPLGSTWFGFFPDVLSGVVTVSMLSCYSIYDFMACVVFMLDTCSLHDYAQESVFSVSHTCILLARRYLPASCPFALGDPAYRV